MNDTERELKDLLESKASEARIAPVAPQAVLKRGRRRQVGTTLIAAGTTLVVVVGSVLGAQGLLRDKGATSPPASTQSVTTRTALIQGLTVASPSDWTLIDEWPVSALIAVKGSSKFSAVGCPIEAGSGNSSGSTTCPNATKAETQTSPTPVPSGLPIFQLSNFDPGLTRSLCGDSLLRGNQVSLYVGLVTGPVAVAAPSGNSFDVSSPPEDGPCGMGSYATVTSGDAVYLAFAGFGADVSDADRQQVLDTFNGLSPVAPGIGLPKITTAGYVVAGGSDESGAPWRIEVRPSEEQSSSDPLEMTLVHGDGAKSEHFTFGDVSSDSIAWGDSGGTWYGAVPRDTTSLEFQPNGGGDPIPAQTFDIPPSLNASALGFVLEVPGDLEGQLVGTTPTSGFAVGTAVAVGPSPTSNRFGDADAQSSLTSTFEAASTYLQAHGSYDGFTPETAASYAGSLTFNTDASATPGEISIRDVTATTLLLVTATSAGQPYCRSDTGLNTNGFGISDAQTTDACAGPQAIWDAAASRELMSSELMPVAGSSDLGIGKWFLWVDPEGFAYFGLTPSNKGVDVFAVGDASGKEPSFVTIPAPEGAFLVVVGHADLGPVTVTLPDGSVLKGPHDHAPSGLTIDEAFSVIPLPGAGSGTVDFGPGLSPVQITWHAESTANTAAGP